MSELVHDITSLLSSQKPRRLHKSWATGRKLPRAAGIRAVVHRPLNKWSDAPLAVCSGGTGFVLRALDMSDGVAWAASSGISDGGP